VFVRGCALATRVAFASMESASAALNHAARDGANNSLDLFANSGSKAQGAAAASAAAGGAGRRIDTGQNGHNMSLSHMMVRATRSEHKQRGHVSSTRPGSAFAGSNKQTNALPGEYQVSDSTLDQLGNSLFLVASQLR
jgi:hypothetical protein